MDAVEAAVAFLTNTHKTDFLDHCNRILHLIIFHR
jgi:hypothetical protein